MIPFDYLFFALLVTVLLFVIIDAWRERPKRGPDERHWTQVKPPDDRE